MSENCRLRVSGIKIQKDNFKIAIGDVLGESAFWQSSENEAEVVSFKRAVARCQVDGFGFSEQFELVVSLRAGFVRVRLTKPRQGLDARHIAAILRHSLAKLYRVPGHNPLGVLNPTSSNDSSKYFFCTTYNPHWLIGTLHEIKQENSLTFNFNDSQVKAIKDDFVQIGTPVEA